MADDSPSAADEPATQPAPASSRERLRHELTAASAVTVDALEDDSAPAPTASLAAASHLVEIADRALHAIVADARRQGVTWAQIGEHLGVSRQAAQKRFSGHVPQRISAPAVDPPAELIALGRQLMVDAAEQRFARFEQIASASLRRSMRGLSWEEVSTQADAIFGEPRSREDPEGQVIGRTVRVTAIEHRTNRTVEAEVILTLSGELLGMHYTPAE